jgi:cytochrome P450 family 142 subfamily A polypeptide 1
VEQSALDPELYRGDPHPVYAWLRQNDPVHWDERYQVWALTKYDEVVRVSKDPQLFCSGKGILYNSNTPISMATMDEPRHGQLRRLVNRGFTPRMVGLLRPRIEQTVTESIDAVSSRGACDFVTELASPLPTVIIADMLGIRSEDRQLFFGWSNDMIASGGDTTNPALTAKAMTAFGQYAAYLKEVIAERKRNPREDLISVLVAAQEGGVLAEDRETLDADELLMFGVLLLVAGNETTRNALSAGMIALMRSPEERSKLVANLDALLPSAVEEVLRFASPVITFARTATRDTELRGRAIREGQKVVMFYPSANRDEEHFDEAHLFRVDRTPNPHLAFGIGNHFCLGSNLARLEISAMLRELMRRLPDMTFAPGTGPAYLPSPFVRGIASVPVVFTPGG